MTKYINGPGVDNKLKMTTNGTVRYFISDHLGSTNALTDANGTIVEDTQYDSFGNATANLSTRYQFTGREFDNLTGLHYYRARWYDASVGRFISEDPIGFAGGDVNLYGYVGNTPTGFVDPSGLEAGWGTRKANTLDEYIEYAHSQYRYNDQEWFANGVNQSVADVAHGFADLLRVGNGVAQAYYCEDNIWGQAAFVMMDVSRSSGIASIFLGATAPRFSTSPSWGRSVISQNRFPRNPDDLLPELPRDAKGNIHPSDMIRIRPEKHRLESGEVYSPRHHGQHYHVETRVDPTKSWNKKTNVTKVKPKGYKKGDGTGFLPGEEFP